jgi:hypothetical protein
MGTFVKKLFTDCTFFILKMTCLLLHATEVQNFQYLLPMQRNSFSTTVYAENSHGQNGPDCTIVQLYVSYSNRAYLIFQNLFLNIVLEAV